MWAIKHKYWSIFDIISTSKNKEENVQNFEKMLLSILSSYIYFFQTLSSEGHMLDLAAVICG